MLGEEAAEKTRSVLQLCQQRFKDYQFGLKLIEKNTGVGEFDLEKEAVLDADKFLSERVVQSYNTATETAQANSSSGDEGE